MFSVGVLYATQHLLTYADSYELVEEEFVRRVPRIDGIASSLAISTALLGKWIKNADGHLHLTNLGIEVIKKTSPEARLRYQLRDLIMECKPPWSGLINRGRSAISTYAKGDVEQCFREALLLEGDDRQIVRWWDEMAALNNQITNYQLVSIGRVGERLSMEYEEERTGRKPKWVSLENQGAGYDILSTSSRTNDEILVIEVKSSEKTFENAFCYLTVNEWLVLSSSRNAVFHLWSEVAREPKLTVASVTAVESHIPSNREMGRWQVTKIPFRFTDNADLGLES